MKRLLLAILIFSITSLNGNTANEPVKGNIHPRLKLSFSERFRLVTWDNAITLDESAKGGFSFTRHRTSLMVQWCPDNLLEIALKLTNEFRYYFTPEDREFNLNEIFIDQLYMKWKNPFNLKGKIIIGRQNIILGEGFLVMDGGPLVGSRSIYFNAARFDWNINNDNKLTLFYLYQPKTDDILPIIHDQKATLIEQPEEGGGLYYKGNFKKLNLHSYFIRKNIKETNNLQNNSERNTIGTRVKYPLTQILSFTCEGAYQFGSMNDIDINAFGGYGYLTYKPHLLDFLPKSFSAGFIYLSGDNPSTGKYEGWDPLFSRWPKWSESYIYTQIKESGVAYWSNIIALTYGIKFIPSKETKLNFDYLHLMATERPEDINSFTDGGGKTRGNLFIGKMTFRINKCLTGHILWENFTPGNFYFSDADSYNWARFELMYRLQ